MVNPILREHVKITLQHVCMRMWKTFRLPVTCHATYIDVHALKKYFAKLELYMHSS